MKEAQPLPQRTVLVVDDDHDNAEMMKLLLETHGCRVAVAYDGATSIDVAMQPQTFGR